MCFLQLSDLAYMGDVAVYIKRLEKFFVVTCVTCVYT